MDEIGFLACVLSATLTLYDDVDVEGAEAQLETCRGKAATEQTAVRLT